MLQFTISEKSPTFQMPPSDEPPMALRHIRVGAELFGSRSARSTITLESVIGVWRGVIADRERNWFQSLEIKLLSLPAGVTTQHDEAIVAIRQICHRSLSKAEIIQRRLLKFNYPVHLASEISLFPAVIELIPGNSRYLA